MAKEKIVVIGSSNTDMVVRTEHLPRAGETVLGGTFFMNPGGKGANQAVAAARLAGDVTFICKTGNDIFGHQSHQLFRDEGIDTSYVLSDMNNPSGIALITVDGRAENCIVVASGANSNLLPGDIPAKVLDLAKIILLQLEVPMLTVEYAAAEGCRRGAKVILNPAPAQTLSADLLKNLYLLTPNETEAEMISGVKITDEATAVEAAEKIVGYGVDNVIITLGSKGALIYNREICEFVASYNVDAVDTTAAGDVFNGALTVAISECRSLVDAARFACKASAISVTRIGAQNSAPYRNEVDIF